VLAMVPYAQQQHGTTWHQFSAAGHLVSIVPVSSVSCGRVAAGTRTARTAAVAAPLDEELAVLVEELPVHHPGTRRVPRVNAQAREEDTAS